VGALGLFYGFLGSLFYFILFYCFCFLVSLYIFLVYTLNKNTNHVPCVKKNVCVVILTSQIVNVLID
jgi:hypothetical protein